MTSYKPQHPLPQEIQKMNEEDTICKYCGVSYLIHNEIKRLQNLLDKSLKEVERLKHFDEREKCLNGQLEELQTYSKELLRKWEIEQEKNIEIERKFEENRETISDLETCLKDKSIEYEQLNGRWDQKMTHMKKSCNTIFKNMNIVTSSYKDVSNEIQRQRQEFSSQIEHSKNSIVDRFGNLINSNTVLVNRKMKIEMDKLKEEHQRFTQDQERKYKAEIEKETEKLKEEHKIFIQDQERKYKAEIEKMNTRYRVVSTEKDELSKIMQELANEKETQCKMSESTTHSLNEEISKLHRSITNLKDTSNSDEKSLKFVMEKQNAKIQALQEERDKTIEAHQSRIQQLRESFMEKMKQLERWPEKLQGELEQKMKMCNEDKKSSEENLNSEHKRNIEELERSFKEKLKKEKSNFEKKEANMKFKIEGIQQKFEQQACNLYNVIDQLKVDKTKEQAKLEDEIVVLKEQLNGLKEREMVFEETGRYQQVICELRDSLASSKNMITMKDEKMLEQETELRAMRECVRRECEERYELTEALSNARTELLSLQRFQPHQEKSNKILSPVADILPTPPLNGRKSGSTSSRGSAEENWTKSMMSRKSKHETANSTDTTSSSSLRTNRQNNTSSSFKHKLKLSLKNS